MKVVMVSRNNAGERYDPWSDETYIEEIDLSGVIDCTRLNTLFLDHVKTTSTAVARVVNPRIEDNELVADLIFGDDEQSVLIKNKLENRVLTDFSVGYQVRDFDVIEEDGKPTLMRINNLVIYELSVVGIGFDAGAQLKRENNMPVVTKNTNGKDVNVAALQAEKKELKRKAELMAIARAYEVSDEMLARFEEKGTAQDLMKATLDERIAKQIDFHAAPNDYYDGGHEKRKAAVDALASRFLGKPVKDMNPAATNFTGTRLADMVQIVGGFEREFNPVMSAERALTSADLPILLKTAGNRALAEAYEMEEPSHRLWTGEVQAQDFKDQQTVNFTVNGELKKLYEAGELKLNNPMESAEKWKLASFGDSHVLTREAMINDDLGALDKIFTSGASRAARTVNNHVYRMLQSTGEYSGFVMSDNKPIFHADHNNIVGDVLKEVTLTEGIKLLRNQKDINGDFLNLKPKYLIVGSELEMGARVLVSSASTTQASKNSGVINPFNFMEVVVDANITGEQWFLSAGKHGISVGYLMGVKSPVVNVNYQSITRTEIETVFDFAVAALDYRGLVKGN